MIYVEPSAILGVMKEEGDAAMLRERLAVAPRRVVSVVGQIEAGISLGRSMENHDLAPTLVEKFCKGAGIEVLPVYPDMYDDVMHAYRRYGKGAGHPARLNFGDCFSYAFSKRLGVPLLFKGEDFKKTDVDSAL